MTVWFALASVLKKVNWEFNPGEIVPRIESFQAKLNLHLPYPASEGTMANIPPGAGLTGKIKPGCLPGNCGGWHGGNSLSDIEKIPESLEKTGVMLGLPEVPILSGVHL